MNERLEHVLNQARDDQGILAVVLFGSQARGEATLRSDVDVCLILAPGADSTEEQVRARLGYMPTGNVDIHMFQQLPLYVRRRVLREGRILFCRDLDALYALAYRTAKAFGDFKPRYYDYLNQVALARS